MKPTDRSHAPGQGHGASHEPVHHYSPEELHNDDVAHEDTDVDIRQLVVFAGLLAGVVVVVFVLMWGAFRLLDSQATGSDVQASGVAAPATQMPATTTGSPYFGAARGPQLLTNEPRLLGEARDREQQQLSGYAWIDQNAGTVRIPIDEAKKLIATRGLPARAAGSEAHQGTTLPARGEASSGRVITSSPAPAAGEQQAAPPATPKPAADPHKGGH